MKISPQDWMDDALEWITVWVLKPMMIVSVLVLPIMLLFAMVAVIMTLAG